VLAERLRAVAQAAQPAAHGVGRDAERGGDGPVACPGHGQARRGADDLDAVCAVLAAVLLSVKSAPGVVAGEGHLRRGGARRATTP